MEFSYNVSMEGKAMVLHFGGTLIEKSQATELLAEIDNHIANGQNRFVVSLAKSEYMNSTGLNILINILTKARKSGGDVMICSVPSKIKELLLVTKLNTVFTVTDDIDEAVSHF